MRGRQAMCSRIRIRIRRRRASLNVSVNAVTPSPNLEMTSHENFLRPLFGLASRWSGLNLGQRRCDSHWWHACVRLPIYERRFEDLLTDGSEGGRGFITGDFIDMAQGITIAHFAHHNVGFTIGPREDIGGFGIETTAFFAIDFDNILRIGITNCVL